MTVAQLVEGILGPWGVVFMFLFIVYSGYKRWWVFGWYAQELKSRNERLENRIDIISGTAHSITSIVEHTAILATQKSEVGGE